MPLVVPQLKTITLGGAVTGLGIESSSFRNGLPHESVTEMEILTGAGHVVARHRTASTPTCSAPSPTPTGRWVTALRMNIELEPVQPFVHLRHFRFGDDEACMDAVSQIAAEGSFAATGRISSTAPCSRPTSFTSPSARPATRRRSERLHRPADLLPLDPARQGGLPDDQRLPVALGYRLVLVLAGLRRAEPMASRLWPRRYRRSDVYRKLVALDRRHGLTDVVNTRRHLPPREAVIQDVEIPVDRGADFLRFFEENVRMSPVWMCPLRLRGERVLAPLPAAARRGVRELRLLGTVPLPAGRADGYHNRLVEDEVAGSTGTSRCIPRLLRRRRLLPALQRRGLPRAQAHLRRRRPAARPVREMRRGR